MKMTLAILAILLVTHVGVSHAEIRQDSPIVVAHDAPVDEDGCHLDSEGRKHCH